MGRSHEVAPYEAGVGVVSGPGWISIWARTSIAMLEDVGLTYDEICSGVGFSPDGSDDGIRSATG